MGKAKQKKKLAQHKRREMIQEVFKKGKKQREIAKKFDEKIAQRQGSAKKLDKLKTLKMKKKEGTLSRDQVVELDKKFEAVRMQLTGTTSS